MNDPENKNEIAVPLAGTVTSSGEAVSTPAPSPQASEASTDQSTPPEEE